MTMSIKSRNKITEFIKENKIVILIMISLFLIRALAMADLGVKYSLNSDDLSYILSGIEFQKTGTITMHGVISAQIMPGMTILIGILSFIFGDGNLLWLVLKLVWITMGCITAFLAYKCVRVFAPKWCGVITLLLFFSPDFIWMDNLILTETPFTLCLVGMIYSTLMMGKTQEKKYFWICLSMYMFALMFKANIGIYPVFAFIYLILVGYDFKTLIKQGVIIGIVLLCFIIPWSIRNYKIYNTFIPLTYGAGNPKLLGTYQGIGYPSDEELDYKTNVDDVAKEKFKKYYDNGSSEKPYIKRYISLETDGIKAKYRQSEWWKSNPISLILSYLILKPLDMMKSVFYWDEVFSINKLILQITNSINWIACILCLYTGIILKRRLAEMFLLISVYLGNILIYATTFSFDRYAAPFTTLRFIFIGIGIYLIYQLYDLVKCNKRSLFR